MTDEVITSREAYNEASKRLDDLILSAEDLEQQELKVRKEIDALLTSDDTVAYQMKSDYLASIKSKQVHTRQSTGIARAASMNALDDYHSDLRARTIKRKVELRATLQTELPLLLDALSIAAADVLVSISFLDGLPPGSIDLKKVITKYNNQFMNDIETRTGQLLAELEVD